MENLKGLATIGGKWVMDVDMFPVFFTAHFIIACIIVREDSKDLGSNKQYKTTKQHTDRGLRFRQEHPFALWLCTVVAGLSGVFVENFLFGEPLIAVFKENELILFLTIIWYLMNYSPFDIVYKVAMFPPVILIVSALQEILRVRFIYLGLLKTAQSHPGAYLIILVGGCIKGNGYGFLKIAERLIRGKWTPKENDILEVTYFAKSGLYASLIFLFHHLRIIKAPIEFLYLGIVVVFIFFRLTIMMAKVKDPLLALEMPIYRILFGSKGAGTTVEKVETLEKVEKVEKAKVEESLSEKVGKKEKVKSKAQKKKD